MSWLPPFSRGGAVRAPRLRPGRTPPRSGCPGSPSPPTGAARAAAPCSGRWRSTPVSLAFHLASSAADGAVPSTPDARCRCRTPREYAARSPPDHGSPRSPCRHPGTVRSGSRRRSAWRTPRCSPSPGPNRGPSPPADIGPTSRMSTINRSPGRRPRSRSGPLSTCTPGNGAFSTSSAESSLWIAPSNHSLTLHPERVAWLTDTWAGCPDATDYGRRSACSVNSWCYPSETRLQAFGSPR